MGIMTIAALSLMFARNTALATQLRYAKMMDVRTLSDLRSTVGSIVVGTLAIEAVGAVALWWMFQGDPNIGDASAAWMGVFHAVSAFCNAGFSLVDGGMTRFDTRVSVQLVIVVLVLLGGIGFPVLRELALRSLDWLSWFIDRGVAPHPPKLSLASRVALMISGVLVVGGAFVIGLLEYGGAFGHLTPGYRILASIFMSVNTRTSGFNSVDVGTLGATTLVVVCVLMFIGGSPGSTAGGIKTTTFAAIIATMRAELSGGEPTLGRRALATEVVRRAVAVTAMSAGLVLLGLLALTLTESAPFEQILFEVVSAFGTVGLSTGLTAKLTVPGKLIVALVMFVGRVGPLTIALAVGTSVGALRYRLARESLPIG
jgi:trk system potassium uptake protein TrkH